MSIGILAWETYPELATNGTLSFDEMQVRAAIEVNVKSMTFDGLLDFKSNGNSTDTNDNENMLDKKADKALVFIYSSLTHQFQQPIAMFASKVGTKSEQLALLIMSGIIAVHC